MKRFVLLTTVLLIAQGQAQESMTEEAQWRRYFDSFNAEGTMVVSDLYHSAGPSVQCQGRFSVVVVMVIERPLLLVIVPIRTCCHCVPTSRLANRRPVAAVSAC